MRSRILALAVGLAAAVGLRSSAMPAEAAPTYSAPPRKRRDMGAISRAIQGQELPVRQAHKVRRRSGGASGGVNGARECARRVRQMARGDVLNWYPGQVRANWRE